MQSKSRNWTDIQLIISSISFALTLGFWSLLAARQKQTAGISADVVLQDTPLAPTLAPLLPGQVMILSGAPTLTSPPTISTFQPSGRRGEGKSGKGGGGGGAASTGSS